MQKQIVYTKFVPRIFSTALDFAVMSLILNPIMVLVARVLLWAMYGDTLASLGYEGMDESSLAEATRSPEFLNQLNFAEASKYFLILFAINTLFIAFYFIGSWYYFGSTPGKMLLRMRVVDSTSLGKPTIYQCIRRFLGYLTSLFGVWSIIFSEKGQALHDKISGTVVIRR